MLCGYYFVNEIKMCYGKPSSFDELIRGEVPFLDDGVDLLDMLEDNFSDFSDLFDKLLADMLNVILDDDDADAVGFDVEGAVGFDLEVGFNMKCVFISNNLLVTILPMKEGKTFS